MFAFRNTRRVILPKKGNFQPIPSITITLPLHIHYKQRHGMTKSAPW